jgi:glucose/arabinose dehydrogenase/mono/diheme cytochrome c family protein
MMDRVIFFLGLAIVSQAAEPTAEARLHWHNSRLSGSPEPRPAMVAVRAYPKLMIKHPVAIELEPGTGQFLVLQNYGWTEDRSALKRFADDADVSETESLLELPELTYSICLHPHYAENGYFYLGRRGPGPGEKHHSRIVRYTMSRQPPYHVVEGSEYTIIEWESKGHDGVATAFGNDGMLYVTSGDGTTQSDLDNVGQDLSSLRSKVLRLDVDGAPAGQPYRVPRDNPFVDTPSVRPETWAYGLRNPWRITCDCVSGQIWVGQNGQDLREFAHLLERGANYGWSEYEGSRLFIPGRLRGPSPFTPPTIEHDHAAFRSLTGGFVYRGQRFPELVGAYLYGDYGTGRVWAARHDGRRLLWNRELADTDLAIAGFGTNPAGDILLADHLGDAIYRLELAPAPPAGQPPFPTLLSDTALFASTAPLRPADGVQPYEINAPAWHDGARAERLLALSDGAAAEFLPASDATNAWKSWNFPNETALAQTLTLPAKDDRPARRVETRILLKQGGDWAAYSYLWNKAQTDATLVPKDGRRLQVAGRDWLVPSRSDCVFCHARGANYALGLTNAQLNRDALIGGVMQNQITAFVRLGLVQTKHPDGRLTSDLPKPPGELPRLVDPYDANVPQAGRITAYFATNCAHCHILEGGGNSLMNLTPWVSAADQHLVDALPQHGDLGLPNARLIAPGHPSRSVLPIRVISRGVGQMPPVGTVQCDTSGVELIMTWLQSLPPSGSGTR